MQRRSLILCALAALATRAHAAPRPYRLGSEGATISYTFQMNGGPVTGTVPIDRADLDIDPNNLSTATADVTADLRRARTGLIFATEAMKSPAVLAARDFPLARFRSTHVILNQSGRLSDGAVLQGMLTLRGVTRPVAFDAQLFRAQGTPRSDIRTLNVVLTGTIDRRDFGATGYAELVAHPVAIAIHAQIEAPA